MKKLEQYPDPREWMGLMNKAKNSNYTDEECIGRIADMVNIFKDTENESDAYMVCKLEFFKRIPKGFHSLIK